LWAKATGPFFFRWLEVLEEDVLNAAYLALPVEISRCGMSRLARESTASGAPSVYLGHRAFIAAETPPCPQCTRQAPHRL